MVLTILIHISQFCLVSINGVPQNGYWLVVLTILIHISQFFLVSINGVPQNGYWLVVLTILIHISQFCLVFINEVPQNGYWLVVLTILIHISQFCLVSINEVPQNPKWIPKMVNVYIANWKITILNGKIHYKWQFPIAMLIYQRVVYNDKSYQNGWFGGTPIHGNLYISGSMEEVRTNMVS